MTPARAGRKGNDRRRARCLHTALPVRYGSMKGGWTSLFLAIALAGCGPEAPVLTEQGAERHARANERMARLQAQLDQRDARIGELQNQVDRLNARLRRSELTSKQLRLRLDAVGAAPAERDRFKKLCQERALEIQHLREQARTLTARIERISRPASRPAETAGGGE